MQIEFKICGVSGSGCVAYCKSSSDVQPLNQPEAQPVNQPAPTMRCYIILAIVGLIQLLPKEASAADVDTLGANCAAGDTCTVTGAFCQGTCKLKVDADCTSNTEKCLSYATCDGTSKKCTCNSGYTKAENLQSCNGASGVIASFVLLLASVVTSRFM